MPARAKEAQSGRGALTPPIAQGWSLATLARAASFVTYRVALALGV